MEITIDKNNLVLRTVGHDWNEAVRMLPQNTMEHLLVEWPHLIGACHRLTRLTAGLHMPATDGDSLLVRTLELTCEAVEKAGEKGEDTLAAFVLAVSRKVPDLQRFTVAMKIRSSWAPWNPIEDYLLDELKRSKARALRVLPTPHPLSAITLSRLIIASRVFSLNDLARAGVLYADVTKSAA